MCDTLQSLVKWHHATFRGSIPGPTPAVHHGRTVTSFAQERLHFLPSRRFGST